MGRFIKRKVEVEDPGYTEVYTPGSGHVPEFRLEESNLFFVGLRGSGKSTLARKTAAVLGGDVVDLDELVVERAGCSIAEFVTSRGWEAFRSLEHECLQQVCRLRGQVVATGGGIVLLPENRRLLKTAGRVFYLQAGVKLLAERLKIDPNISSRPPLSALPAEEELAQSLNEREPLYFACLDYILQADKPVDSLVNDVLTMLRPGAAVFEEDESIDFETPFDE